MHMIWSAIGSAGRSRYSVAERLRFAIEPTAAALACLMVAVTAWPVLMSQPDDAAATGAGGVASVSAPMAPETLFAGYGGVTHTHASDVHFTKPVITDLTAHGVEWIGRPFKSPIYYGLRAMHWPATGRLGGMLDFTHAKAISVREQSVRFSGTRNGKPADGTAKIDETFRHLEFSHGHNMLTLNGLLSLGKLTPALRPYVGGGFGVSLPHTEVQFRDEAKRTYEYQITGPVGQVLAGIEIRLPRVSIIAEYKLSLAPYWAPLSARDGSKGNAFIDYWGQISSWLRGEAPENGSLRTNLVTHHAIVGIGYRHSPAAPSAANR
jgi:lipid A oxidase